MQQLVELVARVAELERLVEQPQAFGVEISQRQIMRILISEAALH